MVIQPRHDWSLSTWLAQLAALSTGQGVGPRQAYPTGGHSSELTLSSFTDMKDEIIFDPFPSGTGILVLNASNVHLTCPNPFCFDLLLRLHDTSIALVFPCLHPRSTSRPAHPRIGTAHDSALPRPIDDVGEFLDRPWCKLWARRTCRW